MKFRFIDDIRDYVTSVRKLVQQWLIPERGSNETNADFFQKVIHNVFDELVMEHVQTGLFKDLQKCIHARRPIHLLNN